MSSSLGDGAGGGDAGPVPIGEALVWTSAEHRLKVNGHRFKLKGLNWFGFETPDNCLHGLWQRSMEDFLTQLSSLGFNALRIPFSVKLALSMDGTTPTENTVGGDPSLKGLTCGAILDRLFESCARRGILIMLDQHRLHPDRGIADVWFDDEFGMSRVLESWEVLVGRFKRHWNLFALDLKNENHGIAAWGTGEEFTDWKMACERVMRHVMAKHPDWRGLFFVGGIWGKRGHWWGGNLMGMRDKPVDLGGGEEGQDNARVVYTPHVYGPDVHKQDYFSHLRFPNNMPDIWDAHWGFLRHTTQRAVVVGEWGGFCKGKDATWQKRFGRYLRETDMADNFYWCLNPNSGDTGGILADDWVTPQADKLALLHHIQPRPSRVTREDGGFRFEESITVEGGGGLSSAMDDDTTTGKKKKCTIS